jgi:hypothetical protein
MRVLNPGDSPRTDETVTGFANTTAHVIHVSIGQGAFVTVPPTVGNASILVALTPTEQTGLTAALTTVTVDAWVTAGELVVTPAPAGVGATIPLSSPEPTDGP